METNNFSKLFELKGFNSAHNIFEREPEKFSPIAGSWAWIAKYLDRQTKEWRGLYETEHPTHEGIYSPTGSGKTFFRNAKVEVTTWAHDINIILNDRKLDSIGFLLPQTLELMSNDKFFSNPRTGDFPIRPEALPREFFHLWLPATHNSFYDDVIEELLEWGVVHFYRFNPKMFLEGTAGDFLSRAVGMTMLESQATTQALATARGTIVTDDWNLSDLQVYFEDLEFIDRRNKPYEKLLLLTLSGIVSNDKKVTVIHKKTGDRREEPVEIINNFRYIITNPSNVHVFCNKYMSSAIADNTLSLAINYLIFSIIKEDCEMITKKRRIFCHLPEAQYSFARTAFETQENAIKSYFSSSYIDGMRETRQYKLYNILDTQQVARIPEEITANQLKLWLMPGFQHKSELYWLERGVGRAHLNDLQYAELFSMRNPFMNRGKAYYIGPELATLVWTRPRQTYHFQEGSDPYTYLKKYRLNYDNAEKWKRWDE